MTMFGVIGCLHFSVVAWRTGSRWAALSAGLLGGFATLGRVSPIVVVGPTLLLPWLRGLGRGIAPVLSGLAGLAIMIAPFLTWYAVKHDTIGLSSSGPRAPVQPGGLRAGSDRSGR
jgi:hypothetical protein